MIYLIYYYLIKYPIYRLKLGKIGARSRIKSPLKINGFANIFIGSKVLIQESTWLASVSISKEKSSKLIIKDGATIGHFNHIYATQSIIIEENVLTADKVYISDNVHSYLDIETPIMYQEIKQLNEVVIGKGAWIGENVCIIGASVGKNSVVGANAVVTKDIPDYCIAVGNPAIIIKKYNFETKTWERTDKIGNFI